MERETIYVEVYGMEATIIQEAERINQMIDGMDGAVYGAANGCPIRYYNEEQQPIIKKALEIKMMYQKQYGFQNEVILIPKTNNLPAPQPQWPAGQQMQQIQMASVVNDLSGVHWVQHEKPTDLDIALFVLAKVTLVRIGEGGFRYTD